MNRRPSTVEDAFHVARRRFVPRVLMLFVLYVAAIYAPDLIEGGRTILKALEPSPEAPFTPPAIQPPTTPPPDVIEPVLDADRGVWVLDQPFSTIFEPLQMGPRERVTAVAQTFRPPASGTALQLIELDLYHATEGMRVSVFELEGVIPGGGRRVFTRVLPRYVAGVQEDPQIVILPQVPLDPDRTYALVLRPAPPDGDAGVSFLADENVYLEGAAWMHGRDGRWRSHPGEVSFRLEFLAVG